MNKTTTFEKYVNLIRKRAWEYSQKYGIEYSELESQGYLIYCECLEKYDVSKSGFSTYLYIQLNRIRDFALTYKRQQGILVDDYSGENFDGESVPLSETWSDIPDMTSLKELMENALENLSEGAFDVFCWILKRNWEKKYHPIPTIKMAMKVFKKSEFEITTYWNECKLYWNEKGILLYA